MMESTKHGDDEMLKIVEQESIPDEKMMFQQVEVNAVAIKAARRRDLCEPVGEGGLWIGVKN